MIIWSVCLPEGTGLVGCFHPSLTYSYFAFAPILPMGLQALGEQGIRVSAPCAVHHFPHRIIILVPLLHTRAIVHPLLI